MHPRTIDVKAISALDSDLLAPKGKVVSPVEERLRGGKVAVLLAEGFDDLEFWVTV